MRIPPYETQDEVARFPAVGVGNFQRVEFTRSSERSVTPVEVVGTHFALFRNDVTTLQKAAQVTKTLGHGGRLRILSLIRPGPLSVCQMASVLNTPVSTVSGHLLELRRGGLVSEERRGKWVYYHLADTEPVTAVLTPVLLSIADDPQIQKDAEAAAELRDASPATSCARVSAADWTTL